MKKLLAILAFSAFYVPPNIVPAQQLQGTQYNAAVDDLNSAINSIGRIEGSFTQLNANKTTSSGHFWLYRPGQLRFQYDAPSSTVLLASDGAVGVIDTRLNTVERYPLKQTPLYFLLKPGFDVRQDLVISGVQNLSDKTIYVLRDKKNETAGKLQLILSGDKKLEAWIITDKQNRNTMVRLTEIHASKAPPKDGFNVPYPQKSSHGKG